MAAVIGGIVVSVLAIWVAVGAVSVAGIETPAYEVVEKRDGYEVREYAPHIVAQVTMTGEFDAAMNGGFRKLADFIFGNNTSQAAGGNGASEKVDMTAPVIEKEVKSEKIAMTAPVVEQTTEENGRVVQFVMPSTYTTATLPKPNNPDVSIVEVPKKRYAAIRFSGWMNEGKAVKRKQELRDLLKRDNAATLGEPLLAQYNPPWTPGPMRRNEVLIELAPKP
ncbi:MAG: heme-binding protein [Candidatus Hydrogenedentes bacterium]|nr:heme-binding protein [Candidatus Hydrogenedentota bacterium]